MKKRVIVIMVLLCIIVMMSLLCKYRYTEAELTNQDFALKNILISSENFCVQSEQIEKEDETEAVVLDNSLTIQNMEYISSDERMEFIEKYKTQSHIQYKEIEDRVRNPFWCDVKEKEIDYIARYEDPDILVNGNPKDPSYDEQRYKKKKLSFYVEYLYSYAQGDIYVIWYPDFNAYDDFPEEDTENKEHNLVGYFYVQENTIFNVRNLNKDNKAVSIFEMTEEEVTDEKYSFPVCFTENHAKDMEVILEEEGWEIGINESQNYVKTNIGVNGYYETYVWKKDEGLVGYQYGYGMGMNRFDFYKTEYIWENYLRREE